MKLSIGPSPQSIPPWVKNKKRFKTGEITSDMISQNFEGKAINYDGWKSAIDHKNKLEQKRKQARYQIIRDNFL